MARISIRMDDSLKMDGEAVLAQLGLNMSTAVTVFMKQVVRLGALPFYVSAENAKTGSSAANRKEINDLLELAANNRLVETGFKFDRDVCYDE